LDSKDYDLMKGIMVKYKLKPSDAIHLASMKKVGIKVIVSEDTDFDRVGWMDKKNMDG